MHPLPKFIYASDFLVLYLAMEIVYVSWINNNVHIRGANVIYARLNINYFIGLAIAPKLFRLGTLLFEMERVFFCYRIIFRMQE